VAHPSASLRRLAAHSAAAGAAPRRVSLHGDRRHAGPSHRHGPRMMSVALLDGSVSVWDAFVAAAPGSTFCHLAGWRDVMTDVLGHQCFYTIACDDAGVWRGILPLVRVRSPLFGDYLVSLPFLNSGGPVGAPDAVATLADHAAALAQRLRVDLLELRTRHLVSAPLRLSQRKLTVRLELAASGEAVWRAFPAKLRSQIRRPQRDGLDARFGVAELPAFYEVFARNMRSLGPPGVPLRRGGVATLAAGCHQSDRPAPRAPVALSTLSGWLPRRGATAARGRTASNYRRTVRSPIRCQPPVYSPISWDAARRAA